MENNFPMFKNMHVGFKGGAWFFSLFSGSSNLHDFVL